jgi:hypothetical protein
VPLEVSDEREAEAAARAEAVAAAAALRGGAVSASWWRQGDAFRAEGEGWTVSVSLAGGAAAMLAGDLTAGAELLTRLDALRVAAGVAWTPDALAVAMAAAGVRRRAEDAPDRLVVEPESVGHAERLVALGGRDAPTLAQLVAAGIIARHTDGTACVHYRWSHAEGCVVATLGLPDGSARLRVPYRGVTGTVRAEVSFTADAAAKALRGAGL